MTSKAPLPAPPPASRVELVPIEALREDPQNARTHGRRNLDVVRTSLQTFRQVVPLIVKGNTVIAGSARLELMRQMGVREVAIVRVDDWTDEQAKAYAIVDNRSAEVGAAWNPDRLEAWLDEIEPELAESLGFSDPEVRALLGQAHEALNAAPAPPAVEREEEADSLRDAVHRTVRLVLTPDEEERYLRAVAECRRVLGVDSTPVAVLLAVEKVAGIASP